MSADENSLYIGASYESVSSNTANSVIDLDTKTGEIIKSRNLENLLIHTMTVSMDYQFLYVGG